MTYIEINKNNYNKGVPSPIERLNEYLNDIKNKIFILFYMEGCGPCNETKPEWTKLKNVFSTDYLNKNNIIIAMIDKEFINQLKNIQDDINSFPTMKFITNAGEKIENYENANIKNKDRTIDSFVEWIKSNVKADVNGGKKSYKKRIFKLSKKIKRNYKLKTKRNKHKKFSRK